MPSLFLHPPDKERVHFVLKSRTKSADAMWLFLKPPPKKMTVIAGHKYWNNPKTTINPLFAHFFPKQILADHYLEAMKLTEKWKTEALVFYNRSCYSGPEDPEFVRGRENIRVLLEQLLENQGKLAAPDVTKARMAMKHTKTLLDIYTDWSHSGIQYDIDEEINFLSMTVRTYWHPLNDLHLLNLHLDRIAQRLRLLERPFTRDDLWREYVRVTPQQRQVFVERFRAEVINQRLLPPSIIGDASHASNQSDHATPLSENTVPVQQ